MNKECVYNVHMIFDHMLIITTQVAPNNEKAIEYAENTIKSYYGIDLDNIRVNDIYVENLDEFDDDNDDSEIE